MARQTSGAGGGSADGDDGLDPGGFLDAVRRAQEEDDTGGGGGGGGGGTNEALERERQAAGSAAEAIVQDDPGFRQEQAERERAGVRQAAEAVNQDPGRTQQVLDEEATIRNLSARQSARGRREQQPDRVEQTGDFRVKIPGTDTTVEDEVQKAADTFNREITDPAGDVARTVADVVADPGSVRIDVDEESSRVATADTTAGEVTETATESVVSLANLPATARGLDEIAVEPTIEVASGGPPGEARERAERVGSIGGAIARQRLDQFFEIEEERLEMLQEGDLGSVEDPPLVTVEPDREAELGGLLAGGVASAGITGGAFAATQGTRVGKATRVAVQPGEEAAIAAANRGLASPRVASAVPGVRRQQFDFGSDTGPELRPGEEFRVEGDISGGEFRTSGGQVLEPEITRAIPQPERRRPTRRRRPVVEDPEIRIRPRPRAEREAVVESDVRTEADLDSSELRARFELGDAETEAGIDTAIDEATARIEQASEPLTRPGVDTRQDLRTEVGDDVVSEIMQETGQELGTELRSDVRTETRQETRTEARQEPRSELALETRTETGRELFTPEDEDLFDEELNIFGETETEAVFETGFADADELAAEISDL